MKSTSLIILCTKHLHNSFCIHFDAFWCILMHSEHLQKNGQFQPKKMNFFKLQFHAQNLRIIHSANILMHFDAFWCILMHFTIIKCNKNHFFDKFVHKKFEKFILQTFNAFWCTLMHFDARWCILMHFRICIKMHAEWIVQSF